MTAFRSSVRFKPLCAALALAFAFAGGCMTPALDDASRTGPFFTPANVGGDARMPAGVRRVVLLPLAPGPGVPAESVAALDPVFAAALQRVNRFEVVLLSREECRRRFRAGAVLSTDALPSKFLERLRTEFSAEAVMFVDVTGFRAFRPLELGIRAKLAEARSGHFIWTFDNLFSAAEPAVANSARHYFLTDDRHGVPADTTRAALQSPSRFAAYVAATAFTTLPPVGTAQPR